MFCQLPAGFIQITKVISIFLCIWFFHVFCCLISGVVVTQKAVDSCMDVIHLFMTHTLETSAKPTSRFVNNKGLMLYPIAIVEIVFHIVCLIWLKLWAIIPRFLLNFIFFMPFSFLISLSSSCRNHLLQQWHLLHNILAFRLHGQCKSHWHMLKR